MKKNHKKYGTHRLACVILMILALLWLTISAPFVYSNQKKLAELSKIATPNAGNEEEATNPFGNNPEEKVPADGSPLSEEYLTDNYKTAYFSSLVLEFHKYDSTSTYIAFHGEILVPPPNPA